MASFGVYLHIPFCASRCDYCAFATWTDREHLIGAYLRALRSDIERHVADGLPRATSVFVGGGTPSLVPPGDLADVIGAVPVSSDAEVTVECNPDDITDDLLAALVAGGVTRVSLGVQSTHDHVLRSLGRSHDRHHVATAIERIAESEIATFNVDLIYGAIGESLADWEQTVTEVVGFDPPHVAAYGLMAEPGTPLGEDPERHPDDDDEADKYAIVDELLVAAGLPNYEISNWARPGHESRHNQLYWQQGDYLGVGCAAHSHRSGRRWWNVRTPDRYLDLVGRGDSVEAAGEELDEATRRFERNQLALRTRDGVERVAFDEATLEQLADFVRPHPDDEARVVLTRAGRLLANEISTRMRPAEPNTATSGVAVGARTGNVRRR